MPNEHPRAPAATTAGPSANPILVEVTRGGMIESRHRGCVAVVDADGKVVRAWGNIEQPVYGRSAIKPLQALPLIESGAADRYGLGSAEIALACASHSGENGHVRRVRAWLTQIGCSVADLECGAHMPYHEPSAAALIAAGKKPDALSNNCSGKHAGFLATARHLREKTAGYIRFEHPVQQRILGLLEQMCGLSLVQAPRGVDGCGIPVIGIPLGNMAMAMARMADPDSHLSPARAAAARRILAAMAAHPFLVAGTGRFCTDVMKIVGLKAVIKTGAEGVYCAALPTLGLGVALKIDDGGGRAAEVAMGHLLRELKLLTDDENSALQEALTPAVTNRAGLQTGQVLPAFDGSR